MRFRDNLIVARLYVLGFAVCLGIPFLMVALFGSGSDAPRSTTRFLADVTVTLLLLAACLVAGLGVTPRLVRWLAAMMLLVAVLRGFQMPLSVGRSWTETLRFMAETFPFFGGPLCVGIWLCFPRLHPRRRSSTRDTLPR